MAHTINTEEELLQYANECAHSDEIPSIEQVREETFPSSFFSHTFFFISLFLYFV